jgi:hypothetical protein
LKENFWIKLRKKNEKSTTLCLGNCNVNISNNNIDYNVYFGTTPRCKKRFIELKDPQVKIMDKQKVINKFMSKLKKELPNWKFKYNKPKNKIEYKDDSGKLLGDLFLTEFFTLLNNENRDINKLIDQRIELIKTHKKTKDLFKWDYAKDNLMLRLKTKAYLNKSTIGDLWHRQYVGNFYYIFAIDTPKNIMYPSEYIIKEWKKPIKELEKIAFENTKKIKLRLEYYTSNKKDHFIHCHDEGDILFLRRKFLRKKINENFPELKNKKATIFFPFRNLIVLTGYNPASMLDLHRIVTNMIMDNAFAYSHTSNPFMIDKDGIIEEFRHIDFKGFPKHNIFIPITLRKDKIDIGEGFSLKDLS